MKNVFKTIGIVIGAIVVGAIVKKFCAPASDEEIAKRHEELRLDWLENGGDKPYEMEQLDKEMVRRSNQKHRKEHPNAEARHREHGWYLSNDD